jgi:tetratricopeptide (TPR) repeat protein
MQLYLDNSLIKMARDNFSVGTKRILAERASYLCSRPECQKTTIGPNFENEKSSCIGRAAHIRAASIGGPRFDHGQTAKERSSIKNGIWLCANCADLIDKDPVRFTVELLESWRVFAEHRALSAILINPAKDDNSSDAVEALLDEAFDALAGSQYATRITWRAIRNDVYERVGRIIRKIKAISPENLRLKTIEACYLVGRGFPDKALDLLAEINTSESDRQGLDLLRARCFHDLENFQESIDILERICAKPKPPAAAFHNLGLAKMMQGEDLSAEKNFLSAIRIDHEYAEAHMMLGVLASNAGNIYKAFHHFDVAYRINPSDEGIALRLSRCLLDSERLAEAVDVLDKLIDASPASSDAWAFLGEAFGRANRYGEADQALSKALSIDPFNTVAMNNQLMSFIQQGRLDDATDLIRRARALDFPEVEMLDSFERILMKVKR